MLCLLRPRLCARPSIALRALSTTTPSLLKSMPPRPPLLPEDSFTEAFLCGTGPGGQKINKTSSAVQLKHLATGIVLKVQATRSRSQNRKIAREELALRVQDLECKKAREELPPVQKEKAEKGTLKSVGGVVLKSRLEVVSETKTKRKKSGEKKRKRKYKALEEEKERAAAEAETEPGDGGAGKMT